MKKTALLLVLTIVLSLAMTSCQLIEYVKPFLGEEPEDTDTNTDSKPEDSNENGENAVEEKEEPKADPTNADELWQRLDETMNSLVSYKSKITASFEFSLEGVAVISNTATDMIFINTPGEEYFYSSTATRTRVGTSEDSTHEIIAFSDGVLYVSEAYNDYMSRICSDISLEDFESFYQSETSDFFLVNALNTALSKKFTKNEDSTWTLSYSKLSEDAIKEFSDEIGFDEDIFGMKLCDGDVKFNIDEEFRATKITVNFYTEDDTAPIIKLNMTFSNFDTASKIELDKSTYAVVDDARIAKLVDDYIDEFLDSNSGNAAISYTSTSYSENDAIYFENADDSLSFTINTVIEGQEISIAYSDGTLTTTSASGTSTADMSNLEARTTLTQLFTSKALLGYEIMSVEEVSEGTYKINCKLTDLSRFGIRAYGYLTNSFYYVVKIQDGEVISMRYYISLHLVGTNDNYYIDSTLYFLSEQ